MSNELALRNPVTELAIEPEQLGFSDAQRSAVLRLAGVEDAPDEEVQLFFHQSKRTGLDPFSKQIYMIARAKRKQVNGDWVDDGFTYTIQTGIDGYRVLGHRIARQRGDVLEVGEALWRSRNSGWDDAWFDTEPPAAAKVAITVNGNRYVAVAMYAEYVQLTGYGQRQRPNSMWAKMPANQLAKCAEAAAWRLAYPNDFAGMVLEDAAQDIGAMDRVQETNEKRRERGGRGLAGVRAAVRRPKETPHEVVDAETVPDPEPAAAGPSPAAAEPVAATERDRNKLRKALDTAGILDDEERRTFLSARVGRELSALTDLTRDDIAGVVRFLEESAPAAESAGK
ncbi:phage recombination protein Bet [Rhodococcus sp. 14-2470-1a]|uniref:phage recombination protein Bet n=1 Tax=Rhodococcus sp. 14-2470-1a TaxID=2023150 RepID=UPI000B9B57DF|nr:phage recombination protein Bet [Rhodococcus sp. 14-2470-1a]OZF41889.1 phage recombination protein Bet [Rhodococcus sp. 14-2470-1a]